MPWTSKHHETHLSPVEVLIAIALRFSREARVHSVPEMCDAEPRIRNYSAVTVVTRPFHVLTARQNALSI